MATISEDTGPSESWRKTREMKAQPLPSDAEREELEQLEAIGYVAGSVLAGEQSGITRHDREKARQGFNFYTSGHMPGAVLMDMDGRVLHEWRRSSPGSWPDSPAAERSNKMTEFWRRAFLMENGDVLAIFEGLGLVKVDKNSEVLWESFCGAHHDLEIMPNGDIWALTREASIPSGHDDADPILEEFVTVLDRHGNEKKRVSLMRSFQNSEAYRHLWEDALKRRRRGDILHTNTLHVLDGTLAGRLAPFRPGNVLFSCRNINTIGVVDLEKEEVVWALQGPFRRQHDPKVLMSGSILLFNNWKKKGSSSVMEIDPVSGQTTWEYTGSRTSPFHSRASGTVERLPNGNTLVVESDNGRAFEITSDKDVVWEFYNPDRADKNPEYVATLFDLVRLPSDFPLDWLE